MRACRAFAFGTALAIIGYSSFARAGTASSIAVDNPWFRFLLPTLPAGGYMTLRNRTDHPAILTATHSEACGKMMLHASVSENGQEKMVGVRSIVIPAHGNFAFRPGLYHVMCMQPNMRPGQAVAVTLEFEHLAPLTVEFRVYGATGLRAW